MDGTPYASLTREELEERLGIAETHCLLFGWCGINNDPESVRAKAASQAWHDWAQLVGSDFTGPKPHPSLRDEGIKAYADRRDAIRAATMAKLGLDPDGYPLT